MNKFVWRWHSDTKLKLLYKRIPLYCLDWSFKKMFDRAVTETCALADISKVYVEIPKVCSSLRWKAARFLVIKRLNVPLYAIFCALSYTNCVSIHTVVLFSNCNVFTDSVSTLWYCFQPQQGAYRLLPDPTEQKDIRRGSTKTSYAVYNIDDYVQGGHVLNVECKHDVTQITYQAPLTPVITAERFQSGAAK